MSVSRDEVQKIARLAELHVDEAALPVLAEQMSRILDYVAQIAGVSASESAKPFIPGPVSVRFRADTVDPAPLAFEPDRMAPAFREGFFLVPRLGAFDAATEGPGEEAE
ncbi:MAG: Asp-tRNA(Asn)/Glu-tRNA(Gln) amidotransferase subunit GatC [Gemmatimonadales bacterium]